MRSSRFALLRKEEPKMRDAISRCPAVAAGFVCVRGVLRILCVCDEGGNRSVHVAHVLRYRGHDVLAVGVRRAGPETLGMLGGWADLVVVTDVGHLEWFPGARVWPLPDVFPRPLNRELHGLVRGFADREGL